MKTLALLVVTAGLLVVTACDDSMDPDCCEPPTPTPPMVRNLSQRWHVLNNIEYAYSKRRTDVYDGLLDDNFTFFFDDGDVGGEIPTQWGRVEELDTTGRLFTSNAQSEPPQDLVCVSIKMDLQYDPDTMTWTAVEPEAAPEETWYRAIVPYAFTFKMQNDLTFIQNDASAEFTVRNAGTESAPRWQLVEFRDRGANQ